MTTEKHSYFYINGELEFVFLNFGATMFVIGGEKTQVSVYDIVTVTSADTEAWAAVLSRIPVAHYEASEDTTAKAVVFNKSLINTTSMEIPNVQGVGKTVQQVIKNSEYVTSNYSISGKLVIGEAGTNPHIQFSLDNTNFQNRFLLWDNNTDGTYNAAYAFAGSHKQQSGRAAVKAGEEVTWEVVTTEKHSYFYVNGELEFVFLNFGAEILLIGAEKAQVTITDIVTITSSDTEAWAAVLAREEVAKYEASEDTAVKAIVYVPEVKPEPVTTESFEIAQTDGVAATNQHILVKGEAVTNNYSVSGKLVIGTTGNNPHVQFSLDDTNFNNRFLLWDQDGDGVFQASYAFASSHVHKAGRATFRAGEEITWEVVTTEKHSYFYVNGELEFVFLNLGSTMFVIGGERTQVSVSDIVTVTASDSEAWAAVLAREEIAKWENAELSAKTVGIPGKETTSITGTTTSTNSTTIYSDGIAVTNNYSVSGKLKVTEIVSNPHIQFLLASGVRFLLWDPKADGTFNGGYQFAGKHINELKNISFAVNEEISWELVTTERNSYFFVNGELKMVFTDLNSTSLSIGGNKTGVSFYDINTITKAFNSTEWEAVLAREEIAQYEALEVAAGAVQVVQ